MNIEKPKPSVESEVTISSPEEVKKRFEGLEENFAIMRADILEKRKMLEQLEWHPGINEEEIKQLEAEIQGLQEYAQEQDSMSEDFMPNLKAALERGETFFYRKVE